MANKIINTIGVLILLAMIGHYVYKNADTLFPEYDNASIMMELISVSEKDIFALPDSTTFMDVIGQFGNGEGVEDRGMVSYKNREYSNEIVVFCFELLNKDGNPKLVRVFSSEIGGVARPLWPSEWRETVLSTK